MRLMYLPEHIPLPTFGQHFPRSRSSAESRNAQTPLSSKSSTKPTAELLSRLWKSVLHSQICSTCLHPAYKYGKAFSRFSCASLTRNDRFQNKRQEMRQTSRHSTSPDRYGEHNRFDCTEGNPSPHPPFDFDANYGPRTDPMYLSDHPRYHALHCHCHCNEFHHHHPSTLRHSPARRSRRASQVTGYNRWLGPCFLAHHP
jgi:hypothetical protein